MSGQREPLRLTLTAEESRRVYGEAKSRQRSHEGMDLPDKLDPGESRFDHDSGNAAGYVLLARLAGADWTQSRGPRKHSPVSPWRPHWRRDPRSLLVRPDEADDELHVLVSGTAPGRTFELWGYMLGEDAKRYPVDDSLRLPAHVVPRADLRPIRERIALDHRATLKLRGTR